MKEIKVSLIAKPITKEIQSHSFPSIQSSVKSNGHTLIKPLLSQYTSRLLDR